MKSPLSVLLALLLPFVTFFAAAQESDKPTVAILRFGGVAEQTTLSEYAVLDALMAEEFISEPERDQLGARQDLEGQRIDIFWGDAGWDLAAANLMVDDALGREADILVTLTTPVTRAALNATEDMDDPPPVLFASVYNPIEGGIASSSCEKPAHATGAELRAPYDRALALMQELVPDLDSVGVIHSVSEISGASGADEIRALAAAQEIEVKTMAVTGFSDFPLAAQGMADSAVEAMIAPIDAVTAQALPIISDIAIENGIPFLYPVLGAIFHGATVGVGTVDHYEQGLHLGRLLISALAGELDTSVTGIRAFTGERHSVNLDAAAAMGVDVPASSIESADVVLREGEASVSDAFRAAYALRGMAWLQSDEARQQARDAIESLRCGELD